MSISQKFEADEHLSTSSQQLDEAEFPMNPFAPTRGQFILLMIGVFFALDRRSILPILPFHIRLIGGVIPPECLMWTLIIADMAKRDVVQIWFNIKDASESRRRIASTEGEL